MDNQRNCINCRNYEAQGQIGYCKLLHKTIINNTLYRSCAYPKGEYITCPYCKQRVIMDWRCSACGLEIGYDIDENGVRSNPHKKI